MMNTFTSIFHEAVIVNEFKGEAEAYYETRRTLDKGSHKHNKSKYAEEEANKYRDSGSLGGAYTKRQAEGRKDAAKYIKDNLEKYNDKKDQKRKSVKESFLDFDII